MNEEYVEQPVVEPGAPEAPAEPDWKAIAERSERESQGRLRELQEERRARQAAQSLASEKLETMRQEMLERFSEPEAPAPDLNENPGAHLAHGLRELRDRVDGLGRLTMEQREQNALMEQQRAAHAQLAALESEGYAARERFVAQAPDYDDAVGHLVSHARTLKMAEGLTGPALDNELKRLELVHIARCRHEGKDPAAEAYAMAKQLGYQGKAQDGEAAPSVSSGARKPAPKSLSGTGGGAARGRITMNDFLALPRDKKAAIAGDRNKWEQLVTRGFIDT